MLCSFDTFHEWQNYEKISQNPESDNISEMWLGVWTVNIYIFNFNDEKG
jgi:hypothetical protein